MTETTMLNDFLQQLATIFTDQNQKVDIIRDALLTKYEVCDRLKISGRLLESWISSGKFPKPIIIGGTQKRWTNHMINQRIYEDNPQLREEDQVIADALNVVEQVESAA